MTRRLLPLICALSLLPLGSEDKPVFTSASEGSLSISTEDVWYLEECDALSRPVSATRWIKGSVAERTSWIYELDSQRPAARIVTDENGTVETAYDASGNVTSVSVTDTKGEAVSGLENIYNGENLLSETVMTEGKKTTRIMFEYGSDKKLRVKTRYENGGLAVVYRYESDDNWTETVYSKSVPVLTVRYENGTRTRDLDEKKY